jgi:hypothetical protein
MPSKPPRLRTIQESEQFRIEKARITIDDRDADDLYQSSVYWPLANDPECGTQSPRNGIWGFVFEPLGGHEYVVYYEFNDTLVILHSICPADENFDAMYST